MSKATVMPDIFCKTHAALLVISQVYKKLQVIGEIWEPAHILKLAKSSVPAYSYGKSRIFRRWPAA
jgi:hypothetical protein